MEIDIGNKKITSTDISCAETAWKIEDVILLLEYLRSRDAVVLGGDILTKELEYNYDSWYYDPEPNQNCQVHIDNSIDLAYRYLSNYIKANGKAFYVVLVLEKGKGTIVL